MRPPQQPQYRRLLGTPVKAQDKVLGMDEIDPESRRDDTRSPPIQKIGDKNRGQTGTFPDLAQKKKRSVRWRESTTSDAPWFP
jgi:hypothetical protein